MVVKYVHNKTKKNKKNKGNLPFFTATIAVITTLEIEVKIILEYKYSIHTVGNTSTFEALVNFKFLMFGMPYFKKIEVFLHFNVSITTLKQLTNSYNFRNSKMSMTLHTHCGRVTCMPARACKACFQLDGELWYDQPALAHDEEMCPYVSSEERQRRAKARLDKEEKAARRAVKEAQRKITILTHYKKKKARAERKAKKRAAFGGFQGLRAHLEKKAVEAKAERMAQLKAERLADVTVGLEAMQNLYYDLRTELEQKPIKELRKIAAAQNIKGRSKMKKNKLLEKLMDDPKWINEKILEIEAAKEAKAARNLELKQKAVKEKAERKDRLV